MSEDGIKKKENQKNRPHIANALNITGLISPMVRSCNVWNVLKLDVHEQMNVVGNMHKYIVRKLYLKNSQENIVMSTNKIETKFVLKNNIYIL